MRRLFYKGRLAGNIEITGTDAHHLLHVLRAKAGQQLTVVDDAGQVALMEMTAFTAGSVRLHLLEYLDADTEPPLGLILVQALLKADKMDFVVQKAVELGVTAILPVECTNCVARYEAGKAAARQQRWQKIAEEAAKQCGRTRLVQVHPVQSLPAYLSGWQVGTEQGELIFCYENEQQQKLKDCLKASAAQAFHVLIGPEGGFTPAEAEAIEGAGGRSVTLGPRILRAETAALASLAALQYEKGDLGA